MKRIFPLFIVLVTLLSCSPGSDMLETGDPQLDPTELPQLDYTFKGVWTVDDMKGDTIKVRARTSPERCLVGFGYDFPYSTIVARLFPDVKVDWIIDYSYIVTNTNCYTEKFKAAFENLEALISFCGSYNIIDEKFRCIGFSDKSVYLELEPSPTNNALFLPFVVTKDDGTLMGIVLTIAPTKSTALLDKSGESLSCVYTVTQIETIIDGQKESRTLNPTMQLKFTSIERVK